MQMATPSTPTNPSTHGSKTIRTLTSRSYFQTTVCLNDWWLVKAEKDFQGNRLAVAGIPHREQQALRVFSSAPVLKRHDLFNLETADGVWIIIKGFINKTRTEENGFPSDVFDHFICGFPPYWEKYAFNCFEGEPPITDAAQSNSDSEKLPPEAGIGYVGVVQGTGDVSDFPSRNYEKTSSEEAEDGHCKRNCNIKGSSSVGGKTKISSILECEGTKPSVVSQQKSRTLVKCSQYDSAGADNSALSLATSQASENGKSLRDSSIEHMETLEISGNSVANTSKQPLAPSGFEENSVPPSDQGSMSTDKDAKRDQNNKRVKKRASEVMPSPTGLSSLENKREKNADASKQHISQPANLSAKKESLVTPRKKVDSSVASPGSLSLRRSRSGRLLLPTMQFWRNQSPVYDADRRITGIKDPQLNQPTAGRRSQRKKRPLQ